MTTLKSKVLISLKKSQYFNQMIELYDKDFKVHTMIMFPKVIIKYQQRNKKEPNGSYRNEKHK